MSDDVPRGLQPRRLLPVRSRARGQGRQGRAPVRRSQRGRTPRSPSARARSRGSWSTTALAPEQRVYIVLPDMPPFAWSIFGDARRRRRARDGQPDRADRRPRVRARLRRARRADHDARGRATRSRRSSTSCRTCARCCSRPTPRPATIPRRTCESRARVGLTAARGRRSTPRSTRGRELDDAAAARSAATIRRSGSSPRARPGEPKAAMHSHRDFAFNTEVYAKRTVGYREDDVTVSVPRLFFGYATGTNLRFPFAVGATVGLFSERPTAESVAARDRALPRRRSSRTCRRCSASCSSSTTSAARAASRGSICRACASTSRPARRCPSRCCAGSSSASAATSTTASARPRCSTSTARTAPAT